MNIAILPKLFMFFEIGRAFSNNCSNIAESNVLFRGWPSFVIVRYYQGDQIKEFEVGGVYGTGERRV